MAIEINTKNTLKSNRAQVFVTETRAGQSMPFQRPWTADRLQFQLCFLRQRWVFVQHLECRCVLFAAMSEVREVNRKWGDLERRFPTWGPQMCLDYNSQKPSLLALLARSWKSKNIWAVPRYSDLEDLVRPPTPMKRCGSGRKAAFCPPPVLPCTCNILSSTFLCSQDEKSGDLNRETLDDIFPNDDDQGQGKWRPACFCKALRVSRSSFRSFHPFHPQGI